MQSAKAIALLLSLGIVLSVSAADHDHAAFTCEDAAGIDYQIQGEYEGASVDDASDKVGAQVIALGGGKFKATGFIGGLPGAGWSRGDKKHEVEGAWEGDQVVLQGDSETKAVIKDGKLSVIDEEGNEIFVMKKVQRESPTLGAAPPEGAIVLFDGSDTEQWENGQLVDGAYLAASSVATKRKLGDHKLHLEFRTPFMPTARGQARGNSGVYVQGRYEVQVLDSFGLEGADNECGGIYSIDRPQVNACFPPLSWQTYDMDFTAARYDDAGNKTQNGRITVRHNGIVIHDDIELEHDTPGRHGEGPGPDALFLQNHGNPVVFRNIWIVEK
jgi:hypothetical protein